MTKFAKIKDLRATSLISQAVKNQAVSKLGQNISQKDIAADFGISDMTTLRFEHEFSPYLVEPDRHYLRQNMAFNNF